MYIINIFNLLYISDYGFEEGVYWSATQGDSAGHMTSNYVQKHVNKDFRIPPAYDHYSFFSSLNTSDRILGVAWIGTACLKFPEGKVLKVNQLGR